MTAPDFPADRHFDGWLTSLAARPVFVGYSGGVDSHLLLHELCSRLPPKDIIAVHVNHGLSARAESWQAHCAHQCDELGCGFEAFQVGISVEGKGLEAAARDARYQVFMERVPEGSSLWLGHHLDDQLETFVQRLLRGSGLTGMSAMAAQVSRQGRLLLRPLLETSRQQVEARARQIGLEWIEDGSNSDAQFDRNFLRHQLLPLIESRWPQYRQTLSRSLSHLTQAATQQAAHLDAEIEHRLAHDGALKAVQFEGWSTEQIESLIHRWLHRQGVISPSEVILQRIVHDVVNARVDAQPEVRFGSGSVRRFRTGLYWVPASPDPGESAALIPDQWQRWPGIGWLYLQTVDHGEGRIRIAEAHWRWQLRLGGEVIWPAGRSARRDLKRLFQEYRLPPWHRDRVPLLFADNELVAVADLAVDQAWLAQSGEPGWRLHWHRDQSSAPPIPLPGD